MTNVYLIVKSINECQFKSLWKGYLKGGLLTAVPFVAPFANHPIWSEKSNRSPDNTWKPLLSFDCAEVWRKFAMMDSILASISEVCTADWGPDHDDQALYVLTRKFTRVTFCSLKTTTI